MRRRVLLVLGMILALMAIAVPAQAVTNGEPDAGEHPYVGQLLFFLPGESDPRFDDPGSWATCSGTLLDATTVVTAGHCTFGTGGNGALTATGSGGNDVWFNVGEAPDFGVLPPSSTFAPGNNAGRYAAWAAALDASGQWVRATAFPHPQYDDANFVLHDLGVLKLSAPIQRSAYGSLPTLGLLDTLAKDQNQRFTPVGYGLEESGPRTALGGDTRRKATQKLVNLEGAVGYGKGVAAKFSNNLGAKSTGGTCFGDSGGPIFVRGTRTITSVTSFGISTTCSGTTGGYRLDQPDDLDFLATFGQRP